MVLWLWGRKSIFCNEIKCYSIQSWPKYLGHYDILNQFCCFYHSDTPPPVQCWNFPNFYSPMFLDATLIGGKGGIQIRNLTFLTACEVGRVPNPQNCRGDPRTFGQDSSFYRKTHHSITKYFPLSPFPLQASIVIPISHQLSLITQLSIHMYPSFAQTYPQVSQFHTRYP